MGQEKRKKCSLLIVQMEVFSDVVHVKTVIIDDEGDG